MRIHPTNGLRIGSGKKQAPKCVKANAVRLSFSGSSTTARKNNKRFRLLRRTPPLLCTVLPRIQCQPGRRLLARDPGAIAGVGANSKRGSLFSSLPALVKRGGDRAFYSPTGDFIQMPPFTQFKSPEGYVSTMCHELGHWSGAPSRLNRDLSGRFGDERYGMEELIALS